jgi:hypothetical protein
MLFVFDSTKFNFWNTLKKENNKKLDEEIEEKLEFVVFVCYSFHSCPSMAFAFQIDWKLIIIRRIISVKKTKALICIY